MVSSDSNQQRLYILSLRKKMFLCGTFLPNTDVLFNGAPLVGQAWTLYTPLKHIGWCS